MIVTNVSFLDLSHAFLPQTHAHSYVLANIDIFIMKGVRHGHDRIINIADTSDQVEHGFLEPLDWRP